MPSSVHTPSSTTSSGQKFTALLEPKMYQQSNRGAPAYERADSRQISVLDESIGEPGYAMDERNHTTAKFDGKKLKSTLLNSFFAKQLVQCTLLIIVFDVLAVVLLVGLIALPVSNDWYTSNKDRDVVCGIQLIAVDVLCILNIFLGLPALAVPTMTSRWQLYAIQSTMVHGGSARLNTVTSFGSGQDGLGGKKIHRTKFLEFCETLAVFEVIYLAALFASVLLSGVAKQLEDCLEEASVAEILVFVLLVVNSGLAWYHLVIFARFSAHQKMQLGLRIEGHLEGNRRILEQVDQDEVCSMTPETEHRSMSSEYLDLSNATQHEVNKRNAVLSCIISLFQCCGLQTKRQCQKENVRQELYDAVLSGSTMELQLSIANAADRSNCSSRGLFYELYATPRIWFGTIVASTWNPLLLACSTGKYEMVEILLEAGFPPDFYDCSSNRVITVSNLYQILVNSVLPTQEKRRSQREAYSLDYKEMLRTALPFTLATPLHMAVADGCTDIVSLLLRHGANKNLLTKSSIFNPRMRVPPLFVVDSLAIMRLLVSNGANLLLVPSDPLEQNLAASKSVTITALQLAYFNDRAAFSHYLEDCGGDVALSPLHVRIFMPVVTISILTISRALLVVAMSEPLSGT